jgi:S-DNA-T family DNA segregation ATPase FtsK/SpoIIIE
VIVLGEVKPDIIGLTASIIVWGIKQFTGDSGIMEVINGLHLENKEGVKPRLMKTHKTETGTDYILSIPPGMTKNDFERNRVAFETFTNSTIEIESAGKRLTIKSHKTEFKKKIAFSFDPKLYPKMIMPFPVGMTPDGKILVEDLVKLPHMMVGGATNHGKTSYLLGLLVSFILNGARVSVVDRKGVDFPDLGPWINLALNDSDTERMLKEHVDEMHRRLKILQKAHFQNYLEYRKKHNDLPYLVLMVDELTQLRNKKVFEYLGDLSVMGRAAGISLILATQRPSGKLWDGFTDVRSQLAGSICFWVRDLTDSQIILGAGNTRGAELPKKAGMAIFNNDSDIMVQAMFLDKDGAFSILDRSVPRGAYVFETEESEPRQCIEMFPS